MVQESDILPQDVKSIVQNFDVNVGMRADVLRLYILNNHEPKAVNIYSDIDMSCE